MYQLVDKGVIQALIIAHRLGAVQHSEGILSATHSVQQAIASAAYVPTKEAATLIGEVLASTRFIETFPRKVQLLAESDQAYVLDQLIEHLNEGSCAEGLMNIVGNRSGDQTVVLLEQVVRQATFCGDVQARARVMSLAPLPILAKVDSTLLETFFEDAIAIMERDQYVEVNVLTPAITRAQALVPGELRQKYIKALLGQANSGAYQGGPAAIAALSTLPEGLRAAAFETLDARALRWAFFDKAVKQFLTVNRSFWPPERQEIYSDYFDLSVLDFAAKHDPGGF